MKVLIKTHTTTYTLKNIKFEHHIAIFTENSQNYPPAERVFVGRNINKVSNCGGPCEKIGELSTSNIHTWDTKDVIRKIEQLEIKKHCLLVTIDCLQTEVKQEVLKTLSETNPGIYFPKMPPIRHMEALLKLILHRICFSFNGKYYLQTTGVAMGQNCAPELRDKMFHSLEKKYISPSDKIF